MSGRPRKFTLCLALVIATSTCTHSANATFELNFLPVQNPASAADFLKGGYSNTGNPILCPDAANPDCLIGTQAVNDPTPFYYERVDGYWHIVIGDPSQGFAQQTYTPIVGLFHSDSGGHEPVLFVLSGNVEQWSGNGWDPLEINNKTFGPDNTRFAGNGTGNPTQVVVRQILGTGSLANTGSTIEPWSCANGEFCQEFLKSQMGFKPIITQSYDDGVVSMNFSLDMSFISYTDMSTLGTMSNIIAINDPDIPPSSSYFDMAVDSQDSVVTGGRYSYTQGIGWYNDGNSDNYRAYGSGTYEYLEGVSNFHEEIEWSRYLDASQNPAGTYPGNESRCGTLNMDACNSLPAPY